MKYDNPRLRTILAGEYVLGTLKPRARARFERLMRFDAGLVRLVGDWAERFAPIDAALPPAVPSPRTWRIVLGRTLPSSAGFGERRKKQILWRAWGFSAAAAALALIFYLGSVMMGPQPTPVVLAVLTNEAGLPAWIVREDAKHTALAIESLRRLPIDSQHAFELWQIGAKGPKAVGVVAPEPGQPRVFPGPVLAADTVALAISLEPAGGSQEDHPTGPVVYQGKLLGR